jgi:hypothetical protein
MHGTNVETNEAFYSTKILVAEVQELTYLLHTAESLRS